MPAKPPTTEPPGTLLAQTRRMAQADPRSTFRLATDCKLPFYWLRKFRSGEVRSPSVNRVQRLYEHLSNHKLLS